MLTLLKDFGETEVLLNGIIYIRKTEAGENK